MKANCHNCGTVAVLEPYSGLCVDCLIARSKASQPAPDPLPFDPRQAQTGERE